MMTSLSELSDSVVCVGSFTSSSGAPVLESGVSSSWISSKYRLRRTGGGVGREGRVEGNAGEDGCGWDSPCTDKPGDERR